MCFKKLNIFKFCHIQEVYNDIVLKYEFFMIYSLERNDDKVFAHSNEIRVEVHCDRIISILYARRFAFMTEL